MWHFNGNPCVEISSETFLWECFNKLYIERGKRHLDEEKQWVDINLQKMLTRCGYELMVVSFRKAVEHFPYTIGEIEYIKAIALVKGDFGKYKYAAIEIKPRCTGSKEQRDSLSGMLSESILVRFTISGYAPLWVASLHNDTFLGAATILLEGEKLNWRQMYSAESKAEEEVREDWENHRSEDEYDALDEYLGLCDAFGDNPDEDILNNLNFH